MRPDPATPDDEFDQALFEQSPLPMPPGLAARILEALQPQPRVGPLRLLGRVAAAVLVLLGAWSAAIGTTPAVADVLPVEGMVRVVPDTLSTAGLRPVLMDIPVDTPVSHDAGGAALWIGLGVLVLVVGFVLAWRTHRGRRDDTP